MLSFLDKLHLLWYINYSSHSPIKFFLDCHLESIILLELVILRDWKQKISPTCKINLDFWTVIKNNNKNLFHIIKKKNSL